MTEQTPLIIALFLGYFVLHSFTASLWFKRRIAHLCPQFVPWYRALFNLLATLLAIPLAWIAWHYPGEPMWHWQGMMTYLMNGLALLALLALFYSIRLYDMQEFLGLRQLQTRTSEVNDLEHFHISPFHRYMRHPWYFLILLILWTRDMSSNQLLIYALVTLYLFVGSWLEERKLIIYHGEVYEAYRKRVAGLIPLPWKILSKSEAEQLLNEHRYLK
jgi:protein-S-isoprenylcysteine O-methyltransferase Ste14